MANRNPFPAFEVATLPRLPIPPLQDTLARYLAQVHPLLTPEEFQATKKHVQYADAHRINELVDG